MYIIEFSIIIILGLSFVAFFSNHKNVKKTKPKTTKLNYKLFYADEKLKDENIITSKLLKSETYKLKGKPDYILKHKIMNKYIPIELKSGSIKDNTKPRENDLMQLATYFLIIEDLYDSKPKYGYLVYKDYMFIIKNTRKLRRAVIETTKNMRKMFEDGNGYAMPTNAKCRLCKYRVEVCEFQK